MEMSSLERIRINGIELRYAEDGEGEPVIFVHGSNSDYRIWNEHRKFIVPQCRMIRVTMRYFGKDPWPDKGENFCMQVHADDLAAFILELEVDPVTIVGCSMGAGICLTMAVQNPKLVKRMFLYEPALATFVADAEKAQTVLQDRMAMSKDARVLADAGDLEGTVRRFMDGVNGEAGTFASLAPEVQELMIDNARMLPLLFDGPQPPSVTETDLQKLQVPVTIALGNHSRSFYRIAAQAAQALLPLSKFILVENGKHLFPVQKPDEFCRLLLDFLGQD